jgi:hypothetical protein
MTNPGAPEFRALCKAADDYAGGWTDGDELHGAVVDYTDWVQQRHPERVYSIYSHERGEVTRRNVPGYAWVHWDNGTEFPVAEDGIAPETELEKEKP